MSLMLGCCSIEWEYFVLDDLVVQDGLGSDYGLCTAHTTNYRLFGRRQYLSRKQKSDMCDLSFTHLGMSHPHSNLNSTSNRCSCCNNCCSKHYCCSSNSCWLHRQRLSCRPAGGSRVVGLRRILPVSYLGDNSQHRCSSIHLHSTLTSLSKSVSTLIIFMVNLHPSEQHTSPSLGL